MASLFKKYFSSPGKFANHLLTVIATEKIAISKGLEVACKAVEKTAKSEFGHYQPEVGPHPAWPDLADSTVEDRIRKGFTPDDPLLRTGELRDSIKHEVKGLHGVVGSESDIMVYQEFGTLGSDGKGIPARPVLGPAAYRNKEKIKAIMGTAAVIGLIGGTEINEKLGYNFKV